MCYFVIFGAVIIIDLNNMDRILHDASYSQEILQLTADTLILVDAEGVCRDVSIHSDLCFMQEKYLLGKNVFDILPEHTVNKGVSRI